MNTSSIQNENFGGAPAFYPEETSPPQNPTLPLQEVVASARQAISAQWQRLSASDSFPKMAGLFGSLAGFGCATSAVGAAPAASPDQEIKDQVKKLRHERDELVEQLMSKEKNIADSEFEIRKAMNASPKDFGQMRKSVLAMQNQTVELIQLHGKLKNRHEQIFNLRYSLATTHSTAAERHDDHQKITLADDLIDKSIANTRAIISDFNAIPGHGDNIPVHAWLQGKAPQGSGVITAPFGSTVIATPLGPNVVAQPLPARDVFSITPENPVIVMKKNSQGKPSGTLEVTLKNTDKDALKVKLDLQPRARCGASDSTTNPQEVEIPANASKKITLSITFQDAGISCNEADGKPTHELAVTVPGKEHLNKDFAIGIIHFGRKPQPKPPSNLLR